MRTILIYFLLLACCLSCKPENDKNFLASEKIAETPAISFDAEKWHFKDGFNYPYRNSMLKDLMEDTNFRKLKKPEVLDLLGEPTRVDTNYLFYRVREKRFGLVPFHTKTMVMKFTVADSIEWIRIHE
ncbi:hypothetical protein [Salinimicrobium sp. WS361]|uniref:hypothetical protein n=1 Tax=Salinimicrobium sp. WS361 TaxID=3425123 RepID=UPI003D6FAEBF